MSDDIEYKSAEKTFALVAGKLEEVPRGTPNSYHAKEGVITSIESQEHADLILRNFITGYLRELMSYREERT